MRLATPCRLRDIHQADLDAVARLWRDSWVATGLATDEDQSIDPFHHRLEREGRRDWTIRLACRDEVVVGFVAWQSDKDWLRQLFVAPSAQRTGVGTLLLDAVKQALTGGFWLRTDVRNVAARRFYESRGLRLTGEMPHPVRGQPIAEYRWP